METNKVNWSLTLIFCLIFGALGFIAGTMSNCGKSSSCEGSRQNCSATHVGHGERATHGGKHGKMKCCSEGKTCKKHSKHETAVEVEGVISGD